MRAIHAFAAATLLLTTAAPSRADVAPPADFVETCTLERQASAGEECNACRAYHGNHKHCPESLAAFGFAKKCRSRGASSWSEVWCRAASPSAPKVPANILAQLNDAQGKPGPMPSGLVAPAPAPSASALPSASAASPVDAPPAVASAAPVVTSAKPAASSKPASAPPSTPPGKKQSCAVGAHEAGNTSSFLAAAALAVALLRRQRR